MFAMLWILADESPGSGLLCECTPVILCTPGVLLGLISQIKVWLVGCDAGNGAVFIRIIVFDLEHLEVRVFFVVGLCVLIGTGITAVFLVPDGGEDFLDKLLVFFDLLVRFCTVFLFFVLGFAALFVSFLFLFA